MAQPNNQQPPVYDKSVYEVADIYMAKKVSVPDYESAELSPCTLPSGAEGPNSETRWQEETKLLLEAIMRHIQPQPCTWVLDYGCGIGRMAKHLCENGVNVIGVETSDSMRRFAREYVNDSKRFLCVSPEIFMGLIYHGFRVDAAISIFTFVHVDDINESCMQVLESMKNNAHLFVAGFQRGRVRPLKVGDETKWVEEDVDIWRVMENYFGMNYTMPYPQELDPKKKLLARVYQRTISSSPDRDREEKFRKMMQDSAAEMVKR